MADEGDLSEESEILLLKLIRQGRIRIGSENGRGISKLRKPGVSEYMTKHLRVLP